MTQETKMGFYEREIANTDLTELVKLSKQSQEPKHQDIIKVDVNIKKQTEEQFAKISEIGNATGKDILSCFLDYINSRCSFENAYLAITSLNEYLKKNKAEDKYQYSTYDFRHTFMKPLENYLDWLNQKDRELQIEDLVKVGNFVPRDFRDRDCLSSFTFHKYVLDRDKTFLRGSIGKLTKIKSRYNIVYFKTKTDYASDYNQFWMEDFDLENNLGAYLRDELVIVPLNKLDEKRFLDQVSILENIFRSQ